jgi:hypothetical protein
VFARHGRQIGRRIRNSLQAGLFIHRNGDYGQRSVVRPALFVLKGYLLTDQQDVRHFLLKLQIAPLQVIPDPFRVQGVLRENAVHSRFDRFGHGRMPRLRRMRPDMVS